MPTVARTRGLGQVSTVIADVLKTSQQASAPTKMAFPLLGRTSLSVEVRHSISMQLTSH